MMNNIALINKKYNTNNNFSRIQHNQQNRNHYRSNDHSDHSPNMRNNNNNNKNSNRAKKGAKNNNIRYINQKNQSSQINFSQNIAIMKQLKEKQHNQIYLEGELNNFYVNQANMYDKKNKNNLYQNNNLNNNYIQKISNMERTKNNRGMPKKSPIPIPKGFTTGKYLNSSNMSTVSKYSNNTYNASYHSPDSQFLNNMSQISGYSNYSHNNLNYGSNLENERIRPYSNNNKARGLMGQNKNKSNMNNNKNIKRSNKSSNNNNNLMNKHNNNSPYNYKVKTNNYINNNNINNNNMNIINNFNKTKFVSKSPNPRSGSDYLINNLNSKRNNNYINQKQIQNQNQNYYNMLNNNSFSNISSVSTVGNNLTNSNFFSKMNQNNINNIYNQNINLYNNNYQNINNNTNYYAQNMRPLTSDSHKRRTNNSHLNKKNHLNNNTNNNILNPNNPLFSLSPSEINYQNYNSNEAKQKFSMKMMLNNYNKIGNNFNNMNNINGYNTHSHTNKRQKSTNLLSRRNNNNNNNYNNINQMVNLHIINKGQIINNNYNNLNNNNMNNLYVYKYDISQNNLRQRKNQNNRINNNNSKRKKNIIRNNYINNIPEDEINMNMNINMNYKHDSNLNIFNNMSNMNHILNEMQKPRKNSKAKNKSMIRNNSSSGIGITGDLNNILNARNNLRMQNNNNNNNRPNNLNHSQLMSQNRGQINSNSALKKTLIAKKIRKIHHFTHVGFNGERDKDYNQDIAFLEKNFAGNNSFLYMAVCDGHGVEGHQVSGFIKKVLPKDLSLALMNKEILTQDKNKKKKIYNIIGSTFIKVNEKLISNEAINSIFSGTTCVSVIYTPIKLICANIGDSRAVVGRYDKRIKKWISINLSRDHKPTEEDEAKRILKKGGRIKPFIDEETGGEVGPPRVWVKDDDVPGLAMTRSFGDRVASIAGTICVPEIKEYAFHEGDKFVILASDGVWEFITSEECVNIVGRFYENNDIVECCEYLYNESRKRWINEEEVVDDITMLLMFFD